MKTTQLCFVILCFAISRLGAQTLLVNSPGPGSVYSNATVETVYPIGAYTVGYEFTTGASALSVSALGIYDAGADGLNYTHTVGLWNTSGTLLGSVTVPSGINSLTSGFAFVNLGSAVLLSANTNYVLAANYNAYSFTPQDALRFNQNGSSPLLNGATLVGDRYGAYGNDPTVPLAFPAGTDWSSSWTSGVPSGFTTSPLPGGAGASYIGANMEFLAVPEPSTYAAMAGVGALVFVAWQRRRRLSKAAV
jgi:hypothetical protein